MITSVREYYAANVVGRVLASSGTTQVAHNYETIPGAIPIPATLSIELGRVVSEQQANITYRFISDYPFRSRSPHVLDSFERDALTSLRAQPRQQRIDVYGSLWDRRVRIASPVMMGAVCVACHNSHPESPKRDWKVGDVRGIQEVIISQPLAANIWSFKYLVTFFVFMALVGCTFIILQQRQEAVITNINAELQASNKFLTSVSTKLSYYLSPQIYQSIFSGEKDAKIQTERKKLTIFFPTSRTLPPLPKAPSRKR